MADSAGGHTDTSKSKPPALKPGATGKRSAQAGRPRREDESPPGRDAAAAWFTTAVPKGAHRIKRIFRVPELIWNIVNIISFFTKVFGARNRFCLYLAEKVNADVGRNWFQARLSLLARPGIR